MIVRPTAATDWLVLRCSSPKTLTLVRALQDRGVHAWTPVWTRTRRIPRSNKTRPVQVACIPSFVFVPSVQEGAARYFMRSPHVADYTILDTDRGPILIPDRQLGHLRKIADKPVIMRPPPEVGRQLRFVSGPFEGHHGRVLKSCKKEVVVTVEGFPCRPVEIATSILFEIAAYDG